MKIRFSGEKNIDRLLSEKGRIPLPPYIRREENGPLDELDRERYQTVYAEKDGAVAAPTAGLHFTDLLIEDLKKTRGLHCILDSARRIWHVPAGQNTGHQKA